MIRHFPALTGSWGISFPLLVFASISCCLFPNVAVATMNDSSGDSQTVANHTLPNEISNSDIDWSAFPESADVSSTDDEIGNLGDDISQLESFDSDIHGLSVSGVDDTTAAAEAIDVSDMNQQQTSVGEVLGRSVGIHVRSLGGIGAQSSARIRGAEAAQVNVYLDGILLNSSGFSTVDLSELSLEMLGRIEAYRGTTPVVLGLGSIGGAINLITRDNRNTSTELSLGYGSWQSGKLSALHASGVSNVRVFTMIALRGSKGDFDYLNRNGTPLNPSDDRIMARVNNQYESVSTLLKLTTEIGKTKLSLLNLLNVKDSGIPGIDSVPVEHASLFDLRELVALQGETAFRNAQQLLWSVRYMLQQNRFEDPDNEVGIGHQNSHADAHTVSAFGVWRLMGNRFFNFDMRLEGSVETFVVDNLATPESPSPGIRRQLGSGIDLKIFPIEKLKIVPSVRVIVDRARAERETDMGEQEMRTKKISDEYILPYLGVGWQVSKRFKYIANAGRYVRTPDLFELFGDTGASVGNPELKAEEGLNVDTGMKYKYEHGAGIVNSARIYTGVFGSWSRNLIAYAQNSQNTVRAENVDSARTLGVELSLDTTLFSWFSIWGSYTFIQGVNRSDKPYHNGKQLPGIPGHEAHLQLSVEREFGRWRHKLWIDGDYSGAVFLDQANLVEDVQGKTLLGGGVQVEYLPARLTLTLALRNLFNTITIADDDGRKRPVRDYEAFPLPGRGIFLTLNWKV